ncbi:hypothetical protein K461DRAFT_293218 [Myriangium duriaei CBS 260.36]|uniref:Sequence orphan n=1 Tax=Myriangium duriaei CBS 260.36 TaxID=1168546 RepID=A0A9P4J1D9_9PEZI|nr:hypothetical protein K461DRAFT_293218 [Myriangium duriaei CBS 260.36]
MADSNRQLSDQSPLLASHNNHKSYGGYSTLWASIANDALSALAAGMTVAPAVSIIDRAVVESVSGRNTMMRSVSNSLWSLFTRPHRFITSRPFGVMLLLYGTTYFVANTVDTASALYHNQPPSTTTAGVAKFLGPTSVNLGLSLYKDTQYARMFGQSLGSSLPRTLSRTTYAIFVTRDCMTLFASFNLPALIAPNIPNSWEGYVSKAAMAQIASPMLMQIAGAPLHLLGLDLYNRSGKVSAGDRWRKVREAWPRTALARMARVLPAFGIGGIVNTNLRTNLMKRLE